MVVRGFRVAGRGTAVVVLVVVGRYLHVWWWGGAAVGRSVATRAGGFLVVVSRWSISAVLLVLVSWEISYLVSTFAGQSLPADPVDSNQTMHIQVGLALGSGVAVT
jgi:hypothetical protein